MLMVCTSDAKDNAQSFTYDTIGRITTVTDKNGNATVYAYDGNGNIVKTTDALGTEALFEYNANDQLVKTTLHRVDAIHEVDEQQVTLYEYDGRNLVTKEVNAAGDSTLYVYDGNGNLVSKTDADGYVTEYGYSALDLVNAINYNNSKQVSYTYNKVGELVSMTDWLGTTSFELDLLGQLKKMTDHKGKVVQYAYDEVGNNTSISYPNGEIVTNSYDSVYNLTSVKDPENGNYTYAYDNAGRATSLTYPNGWVEEYTYDAEGNLLKVVDTDPFQIYNKTPKLKFEYRYDAEGNVTYEYKRDAEGTENAKACTTYTYDALNRLTGSTAQTNGYYGPEQRTKNYEYDSLGNLIREKGPTKQDVTTYEYNVLNQLTAKEECGYIQSVTRIHDYAYSYDGRGNLIKEEEICAPTTEGPKHITIGTYTYDETNRMVYGTNEAGEVSGYTYNGLGVRVGTELILEDNSHGYTDFHCQTPSVETGIVTPEVVLTDYVIDYNRLGIDQRVLTKSETDGYDFRYVYGLDKLQVKVTGEGTDWWGQNVQECVNLNYVHTDRLGSVVNQTDEFGRVTARVDYDAWGQLKAYDSITVDQGYRMLLPEITFATHEYDEVLGQYYAKARMYDAEVKRFTAMDPVKGTVVDPITMVPYLYVEDNPLRYIDPTGKFVPIIGEEEKEETNVRGTTKESTTSKTDSTNKQIVSGRFDKAGPQTSQTQTPPKTTPTTNVKKSNVPETGSKNNEAQIKMNDVPLTVQAEMAMSQAWEAQGEKISEKLEEIQQSETWRKIKLAVKIAGDALGVVGGAIETAAGIIGGAVGAVAISAGGSLLATASGPGAGAALTLTGEALTAWTVAMANISEMGMINMGNNMDNLQDNLDKYQNQFSCDEGAGGSSTGSSSNSNNRYDPSPKHDKGGWGTENPIPNREVGQELLDNAYSVPGDRQMYNLYDGDVVVFQPDGTGGWHSYKANNTQVEVPVGVYRQMMEDGLITKSDYNKLIRNKWY